MSPPDTAPDVTPLRWQPVLDFRTRLRMARKEYGERTRQPAITQAEFAALLGVNVNTYKQWEAGKNRPQDVVAFAHTMGRRTGLEPAWLLGFTEPQNGPEGGSEQHEPSTRWYGTVVPIEARRVSLAALPTKIAA